MPLLGTTGSASFAGIRSRTAPQARGGIGGGDGVADFYPGSLDTVTGGTGPSSYSYVAQVTGPHLIKVAGGGGGGSDYAPGGYAGYAEALVNLTQGESYSVVLAAGGAYGASGGSGGGVSSFTCAEGVISAGGGGGGGGVAATVGENGSNGAVATAGANGGALAAGNGGDNFVTSTLSYRVERRGNSPGATYNYGGPIGEAGSPGTIAIKYNA